MILQARRDVIGYKTVLQDKGINTDHVFTDELLKTKAALEEEKRKVEDLQDQLDEVYRKVLPDPPPP